VPWQAGDAGQDSGMVCCSRRVIAAGAYASL
jgi:hypothetical protein